MKIFWRSILIFCLLATLPAKVTTALAQEQNEQANGKIVLSGPDTSLFPTIRFYLNAYDDQGQFVDGLKTGDIQINEDNQSMTPQTVETIQNGLQVIFALNLGPTFSKEVAGQTQLLRVKNALADWGKQQDPALAAVDDFSLATPTGLHLIRAKDPKQLLEAIEAYQPDLAKVQPSLNSLAEALDLATDPLGGEHMDRALLYITPPAAPNTKTSLADLANRAQKIGVRVNVWMIGPVAPNEPAAAEPLQELARATGGKFVEINEGPLPEIEPLFQPLRQAYEVSYTSSIQKSGNHKINVQVMPNGAENGMLSSDSRPFTLDIQPPNPIFLSPPASIQRFWDLGTADKKPVLVPTEVPLEILIEFPDQHRRAITATRLYDNGKLVAENSSEPFDRFAWPVADLTTPARHMLRVEVIDSQGLSGSSSEIPVDILIEQPGRTSLFEHVSWQGAIAVAAMIASGGVLVLILVLSSRRRLGRRSRNGSDKKRLTDPVTQPVPIKQEKSKPRKSQEPVSTPPAKIPWPTAWAKPNGQNVPARLVTLDENEQPITGGFIPLSRQEITFGSDPRRATQLLESPTVDALHARLYRTADGCFFLADQNSIAGTWVNFTPVLNGGMPLAHGDLIHIGRMMFRFEITDPERTAPLAEIKVIDLEKQP